MKTTKESKMIFSTLKLVVIVSVVGLLKGNPSFNKLEGRSKKYPESLTECVDYSVEKGTPQKTVRLMEAQCLELFVTVDHTVSWNKNFSSGEQNYIKSLFRKVIQNAEDLTNPQTKRDLSQRGRMLRQEVRAAPYQNWESYARNVRRLKFEKITDTGRAKYDIIADIHRVAINSAHFGPNFLPWHRLYLLVLEAALDTGIPYWDSAIDFELQDPTSTILFTEKYFGNGIGRVVTGPFANFETPLGRLFRNIGSDGMLFTRDGIRLILSKSRLRQISEPTADEGASLEGQHDGVHIWVDGIMNNLAFSAHDPVFFTHHAFVDYIWELFRRGQAKQGVDPSKDIPSPPENVTFQERKDPAVGLFGYYNVDGYSHRQAKMVEYAPHPQCPKCGNSVDLECNDQNGMCASAQRSQNEMMGSSDEARSMAMKNGMMNDGENQQPFTLYMRDPRVRMDSVTLRYNDTKRTTKAGNNHIIHVNRMQNGRMPNGMVVNGQMQNEMMGNGPMQIRMIRNEHRPVFNVVSNDQQTVTRIEGRRNRGILHNEFTNPHHIPGNIQGFNNQRGISRSTHRNGILSRDMGGSPLQGQPGQSIFNQPFQQEPVYVPFNPNEDPWLQFTGSLPVFRSVPGQSLSDLNIGPQRPY